MKNKTKIICIIASLASIFILSMSLMLTFLLNDNKKVKTEEQVKIEATTGAESADISQKGGAVFIEPGATYTMTGGTIGGSSTTFGGAVYVSNGATLIMTGGTINGSEALYGGAIYVESGGKCIITAGTIKECNSVNAGGAIYVEDGGKLTISGMTSEPATFLNKMVNDDGSIDSTMNNSVKFENNIAGTSGGAIFMEGANSILNVSGATFDGNTARDMGGAICLQRADMNATNLSVINNKIISGGSLTASKAGAGIFAFGNQSEITITNGQIEGNELYAELNLQSGAGICLLTKAKLNFISGSISYNNIVSGSGVNSSGASAKISGRGSGLYIADYAEATIGAVNADKTSVLIQGNISSDTGGGVALYGKASLVVNAATIQNNKATSLGGGLHSSESLITLESNVLVKNNNANNGGGICLYKIYGDYLLTVNGANIEENTARTNGAGIYCLSSSILINSGVIKNNSAESSSYKIDGGGIFLGYATLSGVNVYSVLDIKDGNVEFSGNSARNGGAIYSNYAAVNIEGAADEKSKFTVSNCSATLSGGAFYINGQNESIVVKNVNFDNCEAASLGGAIYLNHTDSSSEDVINNFSGITASNCSAGSGGALYLISNKTNHVEGTFTNNIASNDGGSIYNNGSFAGDNITITSTTEQSNAVNGGGIYLNMSEENTSSIANLVCENLFATSGGALRSEYGKLTVEGGNIKNCVATNGGGFYLTNWYNSSIKSNFINCEASNNGGAIYSCSANDPYLYGLITDGSTISECKALNGAGIYADNVSVRDSELTLNIAEYEGGGVYADEIFITDSQLKSNIAGTSGGGVCARNTSLNIILTISSSEISLNEAASNGGGIYTASSATITDSFVDGNYAGTYGGGIYAASSLTMYDSSVEGNDAELYGGGIYITEFDLIINTNKSSSSSVSSNTAGTFGAGIYKESGSITLTNVNVDANNIDGRNTDAAEGCGAGIFLPEGTINITNGSVSSNIIKTDYSAQQYGAGICVWENSTLIINGTTLNNNKVNASSGKDSRGGAIFLLNRSNATITNATFSGNSVVANGGAIAAYSGSTLTINGGSLSENKARFGGAIHSTSSKVNLKSGATIENNTATDWGGGLCIYNNSTLYLEDSTISGNHIDGSGTTTDLNGAGVELNNSSFYFYRGSIINNTPTNGVAVKGGGVSVRAGSTLYIIDNPDGDTISDNSARLISGNTADSGAGIYLEGSTLEMEKGSILSNIASTSGGGVAVKNNSTFTMNGGIINSNTAGIEGSYGDGGGVYVYNVFSNKNHSVLNLNGGEISSNIATYTGGGIFAFYHSIVNITNSNVVISENDSLSGGGIMARDYSKVNFSAGIVSSNIARDDGAGIVCKGKEAVIEVSGSAQILNNYVEASEDSIGSAGRGAGLLLSGYSVANISGGVIKGNYIVSNEYSTVPIAGGLYITRWSTANMSGGTIEGNLAYSENKGGSGGNVYVNNTAYFYMTGGSILGVKDSEGTYTNQIQAVNGGGIASVGVVEITGGIIQNCVATYGGGISSYGGFNVDEENFSYDLRPNNLTIGGNTKILDCSAIGAGDSIIVGHKLNLSGTIEIDGSIAAAATKEESSTLENVYPKLHVSGIFNPIRQLNIIFAQALFAYNVSENTVSYAFNNETTLMEEKFVDTEEHFITHARIIDAENSNFNIYNGEVGYYAVKARESITLTNFNSTTSEYEEDSYTGEVLKLVSSKQTYTVTVYKQDGTQIISKQYESGIKIVVDSSNNIYVDEDKVSWFDVREDGYILTGWRISSGGVIDDQGLLYCYELVEGEFYLIGDITLKPIMEAIQFTITVYNSNKEIQYQNVHYGNATISCSSDNSYIKIDNYVIYHDGSGTIHLWYSNEYDNGGFYRQLTKGESFIVTSDITIYPYYPY